jgi:acyl-CoA synthetase (NDP forming)
MVNESQRFILEPEAAQILKQHDIPYPKHRIALSAQEAAAVSEELGYPVVLKIISSDVPHKSDAGGVMVGLEDADQVNRGYETIVNRVQSTIPDACVEGVLVCQQAAEGIEAIVGAVDDPIFGPTVMFGLGGIFIEVLNDISFGVAPLKRIDAEEMIRDIKGYPLLTGARGQVACDLDRLTDLLLAVSDLVMERTNIKELDLNPVRLYEDGLMALDVRIVVK